MRWVWIDRFLEFHSGERAIAVKAISQAEDHLHDVYPGYALMPNALIIEGLAQTGGVLAGEANQFREKVVLAKLPKMVFHSDVVAGDLLHYHAQISDLRPEGAIVTVKATRDEEIVAEGEIVFAHLDQARSNEMQFDDSNFVFSKGQLIALLKHAKGSYAPETS